MFVPLGAVLVLVFVEVEVEVVLVLVRRVVDEVFGATEVEVVFEVVFDVDEEEELEDPDPDPPPPETLV